MEDEDGWELDELSLDLCLRTLLALVTLVEVLHIEHIFLKKVRNCLVERVFEGQTQAHERRIRYRPVLTLSASDHLHLHAYAMVSLLLKLKNWRNFREE